MGNLSEAPDTKHEGGDYWCFCHDMPTTVPERERERERERDELDLIQQYACTVHVPCSDLRVDVAGRYYECVLSSHLF